VTANYVEVHQHLEERLRQLGRELPGPMSGFARLHKKAMEGGALSSKGKELMAVAISIAVHCEGCVAYHVHAAVAAGATRPELLETIGVAILMGGGPASVYAAQTLDAIEPIRPEDGTGRAESQLPGSASEMGTTLGAAMNARKP